MPTTAHRLRSFHMFKVWDYAYERFSTCFLFVGHLDLHTKNISINQDAWVYHNALTSRTRWKDSRWWAHVSQNGFTLISMPGFKGYSKMRKHLKLLCDQSRFYQVSVSDLILASSTNVRVCPTVICQYPGFLILPLYLILHKVCVTQKSDKCTTERCKLTRILVVDHMLMHEAHFVWKMTKRSEPYWVKKIFRNGSSSSKFCLRG